MNYEDFDRVLAKIERNREIIMSGGFIGIPYPFPKMNYELAGIQEGEIHMVTATTGVSKSKYTRFVYIYNVYKFYLKTGYKTKIIYFPLEDSKDSIMEHLMVFYLYEHYGIRYDIKNLASKRGHAVTLDIINMIKEARDYFGKLYEILSVYSEESTPEEIFNIALGWATKFGRIKRDEQRKVIGYEKVHNVHTILIVDNLSNISEGRHENQHAAIGNLSRVKVRLILAKIFGFTVVFDAQQELSSDKGQYDNGGKIVVNKLVPNLAGLATNKEVARDCHIVFGIFAPHRYGLKEYPLMSKDSEHKGYDIELMGNFFRQIQVIKNNEGNTDFKVPLWFDGQVEYFEELPNHKEEAKMEVIYKRVREMRNEGQKELFKFN